MISRRPNLITGLPCSVAVDQTPPPLVGAEPPSLLPLWSSAVQPRKRKERRKWKKEKKKKEKEKKKKKGEKNRKKRKKERIFSLSFLSLSSPLSLPFSLQFLSLDSLSRSFSLFMNFVSLESFSPSLIALRILG